ncbi:hypothetical protein HMPREF3179_01940 [Oligella sp. HMSC09E12]|nr:hypothetical protein HMPREF3179_01940 [Oligella sp. HMSC09E12]
MMCVFLHNNNSATKANTLDSIKYIAHNSYLSQLRGLGITLAKQSINQMRWLQNNTLKFIFKYF